MIDVTDEVTLEVSIEERVGVKALAYGNVVNALQHYRSKSHLLKLDLDQKNKETPPIRSSIEEPLVLEIKAFLSHLQYVFLGPNNTLIVTIAIDLNDGGVEVLTLVLKHSERAIVWTIVDVISIPPGICTHNIQFVLDYKPNIKHQEYLNHPID